MPQINLLLPTLGKKKAKEKKTSEFKIGKSTLFTYFSLGGIIVLMIIIWIVMGLRIGGYKGEMAVLEEKEKKLSVDPKKLIKLNEDKEILLERLDFLEKLTEKRLLWSGKLDRVPELIPDGVWLTEISSEKKIKLDPATRKSAGEEFMLSVKGRAVAVRIQDAIELVGVFLERLKKDEVFSSDFKEIKLNSVTKGIIKNRDIMNFEFDCVVR